MSTNIHIVATRRVIVEKTKKVDIQKEWFPVWQTPTVDTVQIMLLQDKIKAYKDWVFSISKDEVKNVYAKDDYLSERPPVGTRIYNAGKEHIKQLNQWLEDCDEAGYDFTVEAW